MINQVILFIVEYPALALLSVAGVGYCLYFGALELAGKTMG